MLTAGRLVRVRWRRKSSTPRASGRPAFSSSVVPVSSADVARVERACELVRQEAVLRSYGATRDPAYDPILDSLLDLLDEVRPNEVFT